MPNPIVRELFRYPIKGCQGVPTDSLEISDRGISGDREFVLIEDGKLIDQKETPQVASIAADLKRDAGLLRLTHAELGNFEHEIRPDGKPLAAGWILDKFEAVDQGDAVADWLSEIIGRPVRLAAAGDPWKINFPIPQMERVHDTTKDRFFAASPVSLANQASLDDLNTRLEAPVGMDRFRINVIVDGLEAYAEDHVDSMTASEVQLLQVTPAERCVIITTDQVTGKRSKSDLLKVLGEYRRKPAEERFGSGIIFGNYMTVGAPGTLRVGEEMIVA